MRKLFRLHLSQRSQGLLAAIVVHLAIIGLAAAVWGLRPPPEQVVIYCPGPLFAPPRAPVAPKPPSGGGGPRGPSMADRSARAREVAARQRPPTVEPTAAPQPQAQQEVVPTEIASESSPGDSSGQGSELTGGSGTGTGEGPGDATGTGAGPGGPGDGQGPGGPPRGPRVITAEVTAPVLVHGEEPDYPRMARDTRTMGSVKLRCVIDEDGNVRVEKVLKSIPLLDQAAIRAVQRWRYRPARANGLEIAVLLTVEVKFSLD